MYVFNKNISKWAKMTKGWLNNPMDWDTAWLTDQCVAVWDDKPKPSAHWKWFRAYLHYPRCSLPKIYVSFVLLWSYMPKCFKNFYENLFTCNVISHLANCISYMHATALLASTLSGSMTIMAVIITCVLLWRKIWE